MPMLAPRHPILTLGALIASGCGGQVAASGGNWENRIGGMQERARYLVLVVDDSPDEDAAKLRAQIVRSLKSGLLPEINFLRMEYNDPASWHPIDQRVLVARPSAPDEVALVTPVSVPALVWKSRDANEAEIEPVVAAASDVLEASVAEATQAFRPLRAAKRALDLLFGARAPETPEEAALLADPMRWPVVYVVIATTRPTQDQGALADYELQPIPERDGMRTVRVITPWVGGATCSQTELAPGDWSDPLTIENWASASNSLAYPWPCSNAEGVFRDLFADGHADMGPLCPTARFARLASGKTACRITIDQPDLERCDPERGWQDPVDGKPMLVAPYGTTQRRCTIRELEGPALEACRTTVGCENCPSGFCTSDSLEVFQASNCRFGGRSLLRFIGGARAGTGGVVRIRCLTE